MKKYSVIVITCTHVTFRTISTWLTGSDWLCPLSGPRRAGRWRCPTEGTWRTPSGTCSVASGPPAPTLVPPSWRSSAEGPPSFGSHSSPARCSPSGSLPASPSVPHRSRLTSHFVFWNVLASTSRGRRWGLAQRRLWQLTSSSAPFCIHRLLLVWKKQQTNTNIQVQQSMMGHEVEITKISNIYQYQPIKPFLLDYNSPSGDTHVNTLSHWKCAINKWAAKVK